MPVIKRRRSYGIIKTAAAALLCLSSLTAISPQTPGETDSRKRKYYVGVYLTDVSGFDMKEGRFKADLHVWLKWLGNNPQERRELEKKMPIIFPNGEIDWENLRVMSSESDGNWQSVRWRIQGDFRGTFPLHDFPFDRQKLPIEVVLAQDKGELAADLTGSSMSERFSITGWNYEPYFRARTAPRAYASDFGSVHYEGSRHRVNSVVFMLNLRRPFIAYVIKMLLPLAIIVAMACLAIALPVENIDARVGMIITALLACVALNFSLSDSLPDVAYLVTADKFFIGAYMVILLALVETIFIYRMRNGTGTAAARWDRIALWTLPGGAAALAVIAIIAGAITGRETEPDIIAARADAEAKAKAGAAANRPTSTRKVLRISVLGTRSATAYGFGDGFLRRGLSHPAGPGRKEPYLSTVLPDMSNDLIRFLPDGGMRVRWRLREDKRWSDDREIHAKDLAFSLRLFDDPYRKDIRVVDDYTVDAFYTRRLFERLKPFTVLPRHKLARIFNDKKRKGVFDHMKKNPVPLNGPYVLEKITPGREIAYRANPEFQGSKPLIERIVVRNVNKDKDGRKVDAVDAIRLGLADISPLVSSFSAKKALRTPGVAMQPRPGGRLYYLQPGLTKPPLNDLRLRKAVLHAIDRAALARLYDSISGTVAKTYRRKGTEDHHAAVRDYAHDPALARSLTRSAGGPIALTLHTTKLAKGKNPPPRTIAVRMIKSDLEKAGFRVKLNVVKSLFRTGAPADHSGLIFRIRSDTTNPAALWNLPYEKGRYKVEQPRAVYDERVMELMSRYRTNLFQERRRQLSGQMQALWAERLPLIPLIHINLYTVYSESLKGPAPMLENFWWNIENWRFAKP